MRKRNRESSTLSVLEDSKVGEIPAGRWKHQRNAREKRDTHCSDCECVRELVSSETDITVAGAVWLTQMQRGRGCGFVTVKRATLRSMRGSMENDKSRQEISGSSLTSEARQGDEQSDDSWLILARWRKRSDLTCLPSRSCSTCFIALHSALLSPMIGAAVTGHSVSPNSG
jgi:hypothetical protein